MKQPEPKSESFFPSSVSGGEAKNPEALVAFPPGFAPQWVCRFIARNDFGGGEGA
jgi:hypothetical protein